MTLKKNKILIVGKGSISKKFYSIIKKKFKFKEVDIIGTREIMGLSKKKFFLDNSYEFCFLNSPSTLRYKIFKDIHKISKNFFFEKPIASNYQDFHKIKKLIQKRNINYKVGYNLRYLDSFIKLKKLLSKKIIGNIFSIKVQCGYDLRKWRKQNYKKNISGNRLLGGTLQLELSHELNLLANILKKFGKPKTIYNNFSNLKISCPDQIFSMFKAKLLSQKKDASVFLDLNYLNIIPKRSFTFYGTKGILNWDLIMSKILLNKKKDVKIFKFNKREIQLSYEKEIKDFFNKKFEKNDFLEIRKTMNMIKNI